MSIQLSHGGTTMFTANAPTQTLHVATMDGVQTLEKSPSGRWAMAGHTLRGKHIQAMIDVPGTGTLLACGYRDGIYASEDDGRTWTARDNGLTIRNVYSLAAATIEGKLRLFAGTEPAHLFVSDDLGRNWRELPGFRNMPDVGKWRFVAEPYTGHAKQINFDPHDARIIYVCVEVGAFIKSTDGGETWSPISIPNPDMHRSVIDPRNTSRLFTTGGGGLQITLDGCKTWRQILSRQSAIGEYPDQLVSRASNPDIMLLTCCEYSPRSWIDRRYAGGAVAKSVDGGETWRLVQGGLPPRLRGSIEAMCQVERPDGAEYFFGTTEGEIWHGTEDGEKWNLIAAVAPVSKSIHQEMLTGHPVTPLIHLDGTRRETAAQAQH